MGRDMTLVYILPVDLPEPYGHTFITIADSQGTFDQGRTVDNYQKLVHSNGVVSLGAGIGATIATQNEAILSLEDILTVDKLKTEIFPKMVEIHSSNVGLDNLIDVNTDDINNRINSGDKVTIEKLRTSGTNTYVILNGDEGNRMFKLALGGEFKPVGDKGIYEFLKPSCVEVTSGVIDGSGTNTLKSAQSLNNLISNEYSPIEAERDDDTKLFSPLLSALSISQLASHSEGVNDRFQIGILNNKGYTSIIHQDINLDPKTELEYINDSLNVKISNSDSFARIDGRAFANQISNEFFGRIKNLNDYHLILNKLQEADNWNKDALNSEKLGELEQRFINARDEAYSAIKHVLDGEAHKICFSDGRKSETKKFREFQTEYAIQT